MLVILTPAMKRAARAAMSASVRESRRSAIVNARVSAGMPPA
jgi:hypothetical protein